MRTIRCVDCLNALAGLALFALVEIVMASELPKKSYWMDGAQVGGAKYLVGEHGLIVRGESGQWSIELQHDSWATLTSITHKEGRFWATGHDLLVLNSDDGKRWDQVHFNEREERHLLDIACSSRDLCIAVGSYGYAIVTADGGNSWSPSHIAPDYDFHLYAIAVAPGGGFLTSSEDGAVYLSEDGGKSWSAKQVGSNILLDVIGCSTGGLYTLGAGKGGGVWESRDSGESWQTLQVDVSDLPKGADSLSCADDQLLVHSPVATVRLKMSPIASVEKLNAGHPQLLQYSLNGRDHQLFIESYGDF